MGRRRKKRKLSPVGAALSVVVIGTAVAVLLPKGWTDQLFRVTQVVVPAQDLASGTLQSVRESIPSADVAVSRDEYDSLARSKAALEHRATALAVRAAELEQQVESLTATRSHALDGGRIGARGRLIPARVLTGDLLPWRASQLITAGSASGARKGAAVISNHFAIDPVDIAGLHPGLAVVLGETLIGVVEQSGRFSSRVKLLSDPATEMKVKIGRTIDDGFRVIERYFWLKGRGNGVMEIRDVEAKAVDAGEVQTGDWVLSDPLDPSLPSAMVIGRVAAIAKDRGNPLFAVVTVSPSARLTEMSSVYVYDPRDEVATATP